MHSFVQVYRRLFLFLIGPGHSWSLLPERATAFRILREPSEPRFTRSCMFDIVRYASPIADFRNCGYMAMCYRLCMPDQLSIGFVFSNLCGSPYHSPIHSLVDARSRDHNLTCYCSAVGFGKFYFGYSLHCLRKTDLFHGLQQHQIRPLWGVSCPSVNNILDRPRHLAVEKASTLTQF